MSADDQAVLARCQRDPAFFLRDVLGSDPWPRQVAIANAVRDHRTVCVPSCHASGKSWIAARIVLWFLCCHPPRKGESTAVITTAPTARQVRGVLWREIRSAHSGARFPLGGEMLVERLEIEPTWYALGFTAPDYDESRFQGFHAHNLLVVRDEASGISDTISEQIDTLLSGGHCRELQIGNPTDPHSAFARACESPYAETLPISAFDTPNLAGITPDDVASGAWEQKAKDREVRTGLIDPQWVAARWRLWGPDSPSYQARVLGQFPEIVEGAYYGDWLARAAEDDPPRITSVPASANLRTYTAWDIGHRDKTAIWWMQVTPGGEVRVVDYYEASGRSLAHYCDVVKDRARQRELVYEDHFAPHDMGVTEYSTGRTRMEAAADLGIHFTVVPRTPKADQIDAVRTLLGRCWFDEKRCHQGLRALRSYHADPDKGHSAQEPHWKPEPAHDWASHGADAFATFAVGYHDAPVSAACEAVHDVDTRWIV